MQANAAQNQRWKDLLLTLPFLVLFFIQLAHHALWRDELNVVGIVNASPTFGSLIDHVHYEGHPWLWYFILWVVTKTITTSALSLKIVQAFIGTGILLMIGLYSPFSRFEKVLLLLSYFFIFEYTVFARMYGLMVLVMMLYLRDRVRHPNSVLWKAVLLGLLFNIDFYGCILCAGLGSELLLFWFHTEQPPARPPARKILAAFSVFLPLAAFGYWTLKPYKDISLRTTEPMFSYALNFAHLKSVFIWVLVQPYLPVRGGWKAPFWIYEIRERPQYLIAAFAVLLCYWVLFRKRLPLLANIGVVLLCAIAASHFIHNGSLRHFGISYLAFVASLWILRPQMHHRLPTLALVLLGFTALGGIAVNFLEWRRPFSNTANAAHWLQQHHLDNAPIAGTPDTMLLGIAVYLHRPVYFLDCRCSDTFVLYSTRRDNFKLADIPDRLSEARTALNTPSPIFLIQRPLKPAVIGQMLARGMQLNLLQGFKGAENEDENVYIYQVTSITPPPAPAQ